ncbi:MAG: hypothetical protein P8M78_13365 [Myxococcota bacterium]|nr:hypothetical protein [Myxococcota bacterium]
MDIDALFSIWPFSPELWFTLAVVLIIADVLIGMEFFVLSVGVAAFMISGLLWTQHHGLFELFESWRQIALCFAVLSLASIALIKWMFQNSGKNGRDINEY